MGGRGWGLERMIGTQSGPLESARTEAEGRGCLWQLTLALGCKEPACHCWIFAVPFVTLENFVYSSNSKEVAWWATLLAGQPATFSHSFCVFLIFAIH
jgi:hypothetical protein